MKLTGKLAAMAAAATLTAAPIAAQAAPTAPARTSASVEGEQLKGDNGILIGLGALVLWGVIAWLITDDRDNPTSP